MKCPTCKAASEVVEIRQRKQHTTRRRECTNGHRFTTHERPAPVKKEKTKCP